MTNKEKKILLQQLIYSKKFVEDEYYKLLQHLGDLKSNYIDYMTSEPIDCELELKRLFGADYDLCCALLTMLLREDHFCYGSFESRYNDGQVRPFFRE